MSLYISPAKIQNINEAIAAKLDDPQAVDEIMTIICENIGYDPQHFKDYVSRHQKAARTYRKKQKDRLGSTYNTASQEYYFANKAAINAKAAEWYRQKQAAKKNAASFNT